MIAYNLEMKDEWISGEEAANILGTSAGWIRQLCQQNKIKCQKLGDPEKGAWMVSRASIEAYAQSDRKPGPKPAKYKEKAPQELILNEEKETYTTINFRLTETQKHYLEQKYGSIDEGLQALINKDIKQ